MFAGINGGLDVRGGYGEHWVNPRVHKTHSTNQRANFDCSGICEGLGL